MDHGININDELISKLEQTLPLLNEIEFLYYALSTEQVANIVFDNLKQLLFSYHFEESIELIRMRLSRTW